MAAIDTKHRVRRAHLSPGPSLPLSANRPRPLHVAADLVPRTGRRTHNPHSGTRHPAGSLNPASMRSQSRPAPRPAPRDLTEPSRFPGIGFSDSRCWLGLGASIDGKTLFDGFAGSCRGFGSWRSLVPGDGGAVWSERCQRCEVVSALAGERERGAVPDGRLAAAVAEERAGVAIGADRREAGPDLAGGDGRAGGARHPGKLWRGVAVLRPRRDHVQKKACTPANKTGPTSHAGGCGGRSIRAGLIRAAWSSLMRPGPRPT
jgi:hypothetical protein